MASDTLEDRIAQAVEARLRPLLDTIREAAAAAPPAKTEAPITTEPGERFVDLIEAAKLLGCHRTTVLRLEDGGELPPRRTLGRRTGWLASEFNDALRKLRSRGKPAAAKH